MTLAHLGIISLGSIDTDLVEVLTRALDARLDRLTLLVRPGRAEAAGPLAAAARGCAETVEVVEDVEALIAARPGLVLEAAGHGAVAAYAEPLLAAGIETVIASTGALADAGLHDCLAAAARRGGTRLVLPAGAVGAMDILAGLRLGAVETVTYTSRKPPGAWRGTPAEATLDLDALTEPATFFDGTARAAARDYPKNANVAASIALAGVGFERTRVRMVADPGASANIHSFTVASEAADISVQIEGKPSPRNPKTSLPTVYSLAREVMRRTQPIVS